MNVLTLSASMRLPRKASREPEDELVLDAVLFANAHATPPFVYELLYDRRTTRGDELVDPGHH